MREGRAGERADEHAHPLSLANACNPYYERIPLAQDNTSRVFPPCVLSRANPSLVGPGTPRGRNADTISSSDATLLRPTGIQLVWRPLELLIPRRLQQISNNSSMFPSLWR
jgi:hypothetical protein